jgi:ribosomal protein L37AE/L43A
MTGNNKKFGELAARYLEDEEDVKASLQRIKNGETEALLKECEEEYKCPECGKPLPVGRMKKNAITVAPTCPRTVRKGLTLKKLKVPLALTLFSHPPFPYSSH